MILVILALGSCGQPDEQPQAAATEPPTATTKHTRPPPPLWQPDHLVARTEEASVVIHYIVMSPKHVTLFYSVELHEVESHERVKVLPSATLHAGDADRAQAPTLAKVLYSGVDVSLGALSFGSFESFSTDSLHFTVDVSELVVHRFADGTRTTIEGPWTIPIIRRTSPTVRTSGFPKNSWDGRAHSDGREIGLSTHAGGYHGDSAIGRVDTRAFYFLDRTVYFMVRPDGDVVEISEEWYENIDEFLSNLERKEPTAH